MNITPETITILQKYKPRIEQLLGSYAQEADDVIQDCYVKLLELPGDSEPSQAMATLVAWRMASNYRNIHDRRRTLETENTERLVSLYGDDDNADPFEYIEAEEMISQFENMTPVLQKTAIGVYVEGKKLKEIAEELGSNENAVKQNVHRIKQILKEQHNG